MPPNLELKLLRNAELLDEKRRKSYLGIWASESENGQGLFNLSFSDKDKKIKK